MERFELVVIGHGPGGFGAAKAYADAGGQGRTLVLTAEHVEPYERPPLSKQLLRDQRDPEPVPLGKLPKAELRAGVTVTGVDVEQRVVQLGDEQVGFEQLVIASGGEPQSLPVADDDADVHYLRSFGDLERLHEAASHARTAVVLGSGFIGCEAAASLAIRGIDTTLVSQESAPQADRLGDHAADAIAEILRGLGVELRCGVEVTGLRAPRTLHLDDGTTLEPDLILAAVGMRPATGFLDETALQMHEGKIVVDRRMRTLAEGVYAVGDASRAEHAIARRPLSVEHWGDAESMGAVAGQNAAGTEVAWEEIPGFWSEIGEHTLQYAAWGDGYEQLEVVERPGGFTVWYGDDAGELVGVLAYNADDDYERGRTLLQQGASLDAAVRGDQPEVDEEEEAAE